MTEPLEYWRSGAGLGNITPPGSRWPEGPDFASFLTDLFAGVRLVEFGCGPGRLAGCFDPALYTGVDICPEAIEMATAAHPQHRFVVIGEDDELPDGDAVLAHTVLLHVPDEALPATLARFGRRRIVIGEILGRHWRRDGDPPVFNRTAAEYAAVLERHALRRQYAFPYPRYRDTELTVLDFRWTHFRLT